MFQVRMHGPGGQGVVTGAQMMSCVRSGRPGDDRPMVGPEACTEVRYFAHAKQMQALELIPQVAAKFRRVFERDSGGPIKSDRADDAQTIVIALGSVLGTFNDTVDALRRRCVARRDRHHLAPAVPDLGAARHHRECTTHHVELEVSIRCGWYCADAP